MHADMIFEVCVDAVEGALAAQEGGAQRVELCANLVEGGATPSQGMMMLTRRSIAIDLNVIIRPRGGDFCYSPLEYEVMCADILAARQAGANGVVVGALLVDGTPDVVRIARMVALARPMSVTFHRAFDMCREPQAALEQLIELGVERVLTSGQRRTALEGVDLIAALVTQAAGRIVVMPGGGVDADTLPVIARRSGASEFHFGARIDYASAMQYRNETCWMGKPYQPDEYHWRVTDARQVQKVIQSLRRAPEE